MFAWGPSHLELQFCTHTFALAGAPTAEITWPALAAGIQRRWRVVCAFCIVVTR
jgi:hypothetical protein